MIDGNILKFGYGDIAVDSSALSNIITFQQFKPVGKCGDKIPEDVEYVGEEIAIKVSYNDHWEFINCLNRVSNNEISEFEFKGYVFDFSNRNIDSVIACKEHIDNAILTCLLSMAA